MLLCGFKTSFSVSYGVLFTTLTKQSAGMESIGMMALDTVCQNYLCFLLRELQVQSRNCVVRSSPSQFMRKLGFLASIREVSVELFGEIHSREEQARLLD